MPAPTFTWNPDHGSSLSEEPKVALAKFGDGYEVRLALGINNKPQTWELQFSSVSTAFTDVLTFVRLRGGIEPFFWKSPLGETFLYVCRKWNTKHQGQLRSVSFSFEQVFETGI